MKFVLLDLDGTLTDPAPGIIGSFSHALRQLGEPVPEAADLAWIIGPPLRVSFARQLGEGARVEEAIGHYREVYGTGGLIDAQVYACIPEAMQAMRDAGLRLVLCTAKPRDFAVRVTAHFGLDRLLDAQYGPDMDGHLDDKGDLMAHLLHAEGLDPAKGVMIGDRSNDTLAAHRNGVASIGVTWGYGTREELTEGKATRLCDRPEGLLAQVTALI